MHPDTFFWDDESIGLEKLMSTAFYTIIGIELVLLAFSAIGIFALPLKLRSRASAILLKIGIFVLLIFVWRVYTFSIYSLIATLALHLLFSILSIIGVFSITKNIQKKWIKYLARFIVITFILCLDFIITMVFLIGF